MTETGHIGPAGQQGRATRGRSAGLWALLVLLVWSMAAAPASARNDKVVFQLGWDHQFQFAGFYAAQWQGYYEDAGLDVELRPGVAAGNRILNAIDEVIAGRADLGISSSDLLRARDSGKPVVVLAPILQQSPVAVFSRADANVASPADLIGLRLKRYPNSRADVEFQAMMRAEGIDPDQFEKSTDFAFHWADAIQEGRSDAIVGYLFDIPWQAQELGLKLTTLRPATYGVDFYGDTIFTSESYLGANPDVVDRFVQATRKGWEYALANRETVARRIAELPRVFPRDNAVAFNLFQAEEIARLTSHPLIPVGQNNPGRWRRMHAAMAETGIVTGRFDEAAFIYDPAAARQAAERRLTWILAAVAGGASLLALLFFGSLWSIRRVVAGRTESLVASQQALKESEERYALAIGGINDGIWDWNIETNEHYQSPRWKELLGFRDDELPSTEEAFFGRTHPDDRARVGAAIKEHFENEKPFIVDLRLRRKDGTYRWFLSRGKAIRDSAGKPIRMAGSITDIHRQKEHESALQRTESRLNEAQELANIGSFTGFVDSGKRFRSDQLYRIFGLRVGDDPDHPDGFIGLLHPDDQERVRAGSRHALKTLQPFRYEARLIRPDGVERTVQGIVRAFAGSDGKPSRVDGTMQDITDRKQAELALRRNEANLKEAQVLANIGSWSRNLKTGERTWSDQFYRIFGLAIGQDQDALGGTIALFHPDDRARVAELSRKALETKQPYEYEARIVRPDGSVRTILGRARFSFNLQGEAVRLDGTVQDITEQKAVETALRASEGRLNEDQEIAHIGSWSRDLATGKRVISPQYYRILGVDPAAELGTIHDLAQVFHPDDRETVESAFNRALTHGEPYDYEARIIRPADGAERVVSIRTRITRDEDGTPLRLDGTVQDITERKQAENELVIARRALDSSISAIAIANNDEVLEYVNQAFLQLWGLSSTDEALGRHPSEFWTADVDEVIGAIRDSGQWTGTLEARTRDRGIVPVGVSAQRVLDAAGAPVGMMASFLDLTRERQTEAALRRERELSTGILDVAPVMILILDADANIDYVNAAFEEATGYSLPEVRNRSYIDTFKPPSLREETRQSLLQTLRNRHARGSVSPVLTRQGRELEIQWFGRTIDEGSGPAKRVLLIGQDITAKIAADRELKESRERLMRAQQTALIGSFELEFAPGGVDLTRKDRHLASRSTWSDQLYTILELDPATVAPSTDAIFARIPRDDRVVVAQAFREAIRTRQPFQVTHRLLFPDGRIRWVEERGNTTFDEDGNPVRTAGTVQDVTDKITAEQELKDGRERLLRAQQTALIGSFEFEFDPARPGEFAPRRSNWSDQLYAIFEFDPATTDPGPRTMLSRIHPDDQESTVQAYREAVRTRQPFLLTHRLLLPDGRIKWIEERGITMYDDAGVPIGLAGTAQDITARKQMEEELLIARRALDSNISAVAITDLDQKIEYANDAFVRLFGYEKPADVMGRQAPEFLADEVSDIAETALRDIAETGRWNGEVTATTASGGHIPVLVSGQMVRNAKGEAIGFMVSIRDLTRERQTEQELRREREISTSLLDVAPVMVMIVDDEGNVTYINPAFSDISGYAPQEVVGRNYVATFKPIELRERAEKAFARAMKATQVSDHSSPLLTKSGKLREIQWVGRSIRAEGRGARLLMTGTDITDSLAAERELKRSRERLLEAQDTAHIGSWELNLIDGSLEWSDEIFRIFEIDKEKFGASYDAFLNIIHPDDREAVNDIYQTSVAERAPYHIVHRLLLPDGRIKWVEERGKTSYADGGQALYSSGTVQDVTQQVLAQRALENSQALLLEAQRTARIGSFETIFDCSRADLDVAALRQSKTTWSDETYRIIGAEPGSVRPGFYAIAALMPADMLAQAERTYVNSIKTKDEEVYVRPVTLPDGRTRWVEVRAKVVESADGRTTRSSGTLQDVTERVETQRALEKSRLFLLEAQRTARIGSFEMILDGPRAQLDTAALRNARTTWSDETFRILGLEPGEVSPGHEAVASALGVENRDLVLARTVESLKSEDGGTYVRKITLANGETRWLEMRNRIEESADGKTTRAYGTIQDVTERVLFEEELQRSIAEKETLLREIHHRVKNNLQVISSLLYFQAKKVSDPADVAVMSESRERLRSMILVHEKLYGAKDLSRVDFGGYIRSLVDQLARSYGSNEKKIDLELDIGRFDLPIEQALPCGMIVTELLINTYKYAFPQQMTGSIEVRCVSEDDTVRITVADDGVGLPDDYSKGGADSFGWNLINNLARQVDGTLAVSRTAGTAVTLTLAKPRVH